MSMILPTRVRPLGGSLLFVGADILHHLRRVRPVSSLWDEMRSGNIVGSYSRFILALDMLFILGLIEQTESGYIRKVVPNASQD